MNACTVVEVEWDDTQTRHAWSNWTELPTQAWQIKSVGYVIRDDDTGFVLVESLGKSVTSVSKDYGCATFIPRSAVRKVTRLRPEDSK